jgi:large subunit ribosomal protein L21
MYAIIKTGSKQYKVAKGDIINVERLAGSIGDAVEFNDVLFVFDGKDYEVGLPSITKFFIKGELLGETKGEKLTSVKYKPRKRQNKKFGHRQTYSKVKITDFVKREKESSKHGT